MTLPAYQISSEAQQFNWLLGRFADRDRRGQRGDRRFV